jgi:NTP pyrophosphatase (non-canonical NTP hydrolase)
LTNTTDFIIIEYNLSIKGEVSNMTTNKIKTHDFPVVALINKIKDWHQNRNLIEGSTDKDQVLKLTQELGELSDSVCKGNDIRDDLGDMMVVMINIMVRNDISMNECLTVAYNDIKDRKGRMVDGIFVKEADL